MVAWRIAFRRKPLCGLAQGRSHLRRTNVCLHIVHPNDFDALPSRDRGGRQRAFEPLVRGQIQDFADRRLPRNTEQNGKAEHAQLAETAHDFEILVVRFQKTDSRIENATFSRDARLRRDRE